MIKLLFSYENITSLGLTGKPNQLISSHHESTLPVIGHGRFFFGEMEQALFMR